MANQKFTWVKTHEQIVDFLSQKENQQQELIDLLKSVGITQFKDQDRKGEHDIELEEIDPFTFFCYIYKHGSAKRLSFLQKIAKKLQIHYPTDDYGIPSAQPQKVWLFPYKYNRTNNEIPRLWAFFKKAITNQLTDADFDDVLQIRSVGKTKLTEALFYINPQKYLPINGPTKPYIQDVLGINPKFNSYSDYLRKLEEIKNKANSPFYELSYTAWLWNRKRKTINYWIFQGNPNVFNIVEALTSNELTTWPVNAHKDKIKIGDKAIIWATGSQSGCYALATVDSEIFALKDSEDEGQHYADSKSNTTHDKVSITIDYNLASNPILWSKIKHTPSLSKLKVGNQGTNFSATKEEYNTFVKLAKKQSEISTPSHRKYWIYSPGSRAMYLEEFVEQGIMAIDWDEIGDLDRYKTREKITDAFKKISPDKNRTNDITANDEFRNYINIGDIIILKRSRNEILGYGIVTSDYYFDSSRRYFQKCRRVDWKKIGLWTIAHNSNIKTLTDITPFPDYVQKLVTLLGIDTKTTNNHAMKLSLNTILYGPPGTGKTYYLKNSLMDLFTSREDTITREDFVKNIIQECSWWQVIGLVMLDLGKTKVREIINHEFLQVKIQLSNSKTIANTVWGQLQSHTIDECENVKFKKRTPPLFFNKTEESEWEISMEHLQEQAPELLELQDKINNFEQLPKKEIKRYEFLTFHQSYSYEDFIEGIKPELSDSDIAYTIEEGVFLKMCNRARSDAKNDYAIFIDEINRGNISSIFGELITLIEDDKREGKPNEISATLPYSKTHFSVPSNLYIIGTMNTADRSVEALDTALRRRFSFIEMNPDPQKLSTPEFQCEGIDLTQLLQTINNRIEKLLDKDYCIGHSYFMAIEEPANPLEELREIFKNKILPLLQEYFYGDWGKIMMILGKEFIIKETNTITFLGEGDDDNLEEYQEKPTYHFTDSKTWSMQSFRSIYE